MTINIPSYANDYEFVVCFKSENNTLEYWSVETRGWEAEKQCNLIREKGLEPIILHNVRIQGIKK